MNATQAFDSLAETLAQLDPAKVAQLKTSDEAMQRIEFLFYQKKADSISTEERFELERFIALDTLMSLAKAKAKRMLDR